MAELDTQAGRAGEMLNDGAVCMDDSPASLAAALRHDVELAIEIDLEPVDWSSWSP